MMKKLIKELDAVDWFLLIASAVLLLLISHLDFITEVAL